MIEIGPSREKDQNPFTGAAEGHKAAVADGIVVAAEVVVVRAEGGGNGGGGGRKDGSGGFEEARERELGR